MIPTGGHAPQHPAWLQAVADDGRYDWARFAWNSAASVEGAYYDAGLADDIVELWPIYFRHTEGRWAGKPFRLTIWEEIIVRLLVGWKLPDGFRLFRRLLLWVGKKNGKSEFIAALALLFWIFDGEMGGQAYAMARNEKQAKIIFQKAKMMIALSPDLNGLAKQFKTSIWLPELWARFELLTGKAEGKHGLSASVVVGDEMHEWTDGTLYTTLRQSTAARDQPIELLGSTAGFKGRGYGQELYDESLAILEGRIVDPSTLVVIFTVPAEVEWTDERNWPLANPNLGISPKIEFLRAECAKAKANPRLENDFRRYHLNQWTDQKTRWLPGEFWDRCTEYPDDKDFWRRLPVMMKGRRAWGGIDLAQVSDLTALLLIFEPTEEFKRWVWLPWCWVPEATVETRSKEDRVPYDLWVESGALLETPGNVTDYAYLKRDTLQAAEDYDIAMIGYDRYNSSQTIIDLNTEIGHKTPFAKYGQGFVSMSPASKAFERLVLSAGIEHGNHPVLAWCFRNLAIMRDAAGNIKPAKDKAAEKIDPMVAGIMAHGCANGEQPEAPVDISDFLTKPVMSA